MIWELVKRIPTPTYGFYGGYYARARSEAKPDHPDPIDELDTIFHAHDHGDSNSTLIAKLKTVQDPDLKYPVYGALFRRAAILVFQVAVFFKVE